MRRIAGHAELKRGTKAKARKASICPYGKPGPQKTSALYGCLHHHIVALPAPEALLALPAPPSNEGMVVDPEAERRKRPREELDFDNAQPASGNQGAGAQSNRHVHQESQTVDLFLAMASVQSFQEVHVQDDSVTVTRTDVIASAR